MTSKEVVTLDDALRFDVECCTEKLKAAFDLVKKVHPNKPTAVQVILLNRALITTYTETPEALFPLMDAVIGKFLIPELTPEEQYSVRMFDIRSENNG